MDLITSDVFSSLLLVALFIFIIWLLYRIVKWSKKAPKGAYVFVALLPMMSIFPIPAQEIKKLEQIKQQQIQDEEESGDDLDKNDELEQ